MTEVEVCEDSGFNKTFLIYITLLATIGGFLFGYDTGIISGAMLFVRKEFSLSDFWNELIVSSTVFGAWIFSICAGFLADHIGRKAVIIISSIVFVVGALVMAFATSKINLVVGRFVLGIGVGLASMIVPIYNAEIAPLSLRGSLVALNEVCINFGQFAATVVAGIFSSNEKTGWRFMVGIAAIPAAVQLVGFIFTPESPRYLVRRGKLDKALKLLRKIQPKNPKVEHQIELIRKNSEECESKASIFKMLRRICKTRTVRKALFVGSCLHIFQQMVGINTVMYYTATIIKNAGFKNKSTAIWLSSIVAFVPVAVTFLSFYLLEKIGRRITFLISLVGTVFSLFALAVTFRMIDSSQPNTLWLNNTEALDNNNASLNCMEANRKEDCSRCTSFVECGICYKIESVDSVKMDCLPIDAKAEVRSAFGMCKNGTDNEQKIFWEPEDCPTLQKTLYSILVVCCLMSYLFFFSFGVGPVPWVMNSEIYPMWARGVCTAFATSMNWLTNFIFSVTFLTLVELLSSFGAFSLYGFFGVIGLFLFYYTLPETKGTSLENTEKLFECSLTNKEEINSQQLNN